MRLRKETIGLRTEMLENENIIVFSSVDWGHVPTSKKFISSILSRTNKVLYVETLGSRSPGLKMIHFHRIFKRLLNWLRGVKKVPLAEGGTIFVYSPVALPGWIPFAGLINSWLIRRKLKKLAGQLGLIHPILWFYLPLPLNLVEPLDPKMIIYHCVDEWSTYPGGMNQVLLELERELLKKADIVFASSQPLSRKKKEINQHTYCLPHGADFDHFNKSLNDQDIPDDIKKIKKPVLGVVGAVAEWLDWELLKYLVQKHPEWSIVFLGGISYNVDIRPVKEIKNIYFLGQKDYDDLPRYYRAINVCLLPFLMTDHIKYCNPTRLYEYLSNGKPVVSSDFSSPREVPGELIKIAASKEEWVRLIEQSLKEDRPELIEQRKRLARGNTWQERVNQLSELIEKHPEKLIKPGRKDPGSL
ncbi:MAG: glycosyltransferase [Planctomycetes bacterium]|nr:glycosyltransferase [Planctomycetota bacterium]